MSDMWGAVHTLAEEVSQQLPSSFQVSANYIVIVLGTFIVHELAWIGANALYVVRIQRGNLIKAMYSDDIFCLYCQGLDHFKLLQKYKIDPSYYPSQELVMSSIQKLAMGHIFQVSISVSPAVWKTVP